MQACLFSLRFNHSPNYPKPKLQPETTIVCLRHDAATDPFHLGQCSSGSGSGSNSSYCYERVRQNRYGKTTKRLIREVCVLGSPQAPSPDVILTSLYYLTGRLEMLPGSLYQLLKV